MLLRETTNGTSLFGEDTGRTCHELGDHCANLSDPAVEYLANRGGIKHTPDLFFHVIAVLHAPAYAAENLDALMQDWPRIPLPATREALLKSAALGRRVAALLDTERSVDTVTTGKLTAAMKVIGVPTKIDRGQLAGADYDVTARWGITGKGGITMPSTGKAVPRAFTAEEKTALGEGVSLLGPDTLDVYLNDRAYWKNVPRKVWEYHLGGYQVLKKWLSYRELAILGRGLRIDEVAHVRDTARRIAALLLLGPQLDANYAAVTGAAYEWPRG
jgi:hypothetical protein